MRTRPHPSTKPYYECFSCPDFGKTCGGKSTRGMTIRELCEYLRDLKEWRRSKGDIITNQQVADAVGISDSTVERIFAISIDKDINRDIGRRMEIFMVGTDAEKPCCREYTNPALLERIATLEKEVERWQNENDLKAKIIAKLI